jgi:hypothetical protein
VPMGTRRLSSRTRRTGLFRGPRADMWEQVIEMVLAHQAQWKAEHKDVGELSEHSRRPGRAPTAPCGVIGNVLDSACLPSAPRQTHRAAARMASGLAS